MKTVLVKPETMKNDWWIVDAADLVVGRLATRVARVLMGKHKPDYTPHVPCGDFVIIVNAEKVKFTGNKWADKIYQHYSGYPSGQKRMPAEKLREKSPETIIKLAVARMLPKNKLQYVMLKRLRIFAGAEHPHQAQGPKPLSITT